jgi:hypothetical protein
MSGRFDYIRHVFPTKGHSYLPCDRDFARIGLRKIKQDTVYTPEQWVNIMKESANNLSTLDVEQSMIKDYKTLFSSFTDPVPLCRNQGKWKVTKYKIIEFRNSCLTISISSSGLPTETFKFREKRIPDFRSLKRAYDDEIGLKPAKARDIAKYLPSIDPQHRPYFEHMLQKYGNQGDGNTDSESEAWDSD